MAFYGQSIRNVNAVKKFSVVTAMSIELAEKNIRINKLYLLCIKY